MTYCEILACDIIMQVLLSGELPAFIDLCDCDNVASRELLRDNNASVETEIRASVG